MNQPICQTPCGAIRGIQLSEEVYAFRGIRYATAGRWEYPAPITHWQGVYDATQFGPNAMQTAAFAPKKEGSFYEHEFREGLPYTYSEDCQYLNIYAPAGAHKAPVIVYIHGGAYMGGSGWDKVFSEPVWPQQGAVAVTLNYRLGLFGSVMLEELAAEAGHAGNYQVYDQLAALEWVYRNIATFGGDPENITLMGQSAGARSVQMLVGSPRMKGIIQKAVMSSGGGSSSHLFNGVPTVEETTAAWENWRKKLGSPTLAELRAMSAEKLMQSIGLLFQEYGFQKAILYISPIYDGVDFPLPGTDPALPNGWLEIPYLCGANSQDIVPGLVQDAAAWTASRSVPSYAYAFCRQLPGDAYGAWHSADLWYWFGSLQNCWRPFTETDKSLSHIMNACLLRFAQTGDPNGPDIPLWLPSQEANGRVMRLDEICAMGEPPMQETGLML